MSSSLFATESDFENLIVGYKPVAAEATASGLPVRFPHRLWTKLQIFLREVATVSFENDASGKYCPHQWQAQYRLSVYKEMRFNTVKVVDGVIRRLAVIEQALPGYRFQVITNQGTFIKNAIGEVKSSAVLGYPCGGDLVRLPSSFGDDVDCQLGYLDFHCRNFQLDVL